MKPRSLFHRGTLSGALFTLVLTGIGAWLFVMSGAAAHGQIFATDTDQSGGTAIIREYTNAGATVNSALISATGSFWAAIAVSGSNLFVTDIYHGSVGEYTMSGTTVNATLVTGLNYPTAIAVSEDGGSVFVANLGAGTIGKYDAATGAAVNASLVTGLKSPTGIAVSGSNLFVVSSGTGANTGTIGEYTTTGDAVNATLVTGLQSPAGIAVSGSNLFVTVGGQFGAIGEYTTTGAVVNATLTTLAQYPGGIVASGSNLFALSNFSSEIDGFTTAGSPQNNFSAIGLNQGRGIAVIPSSSEVDVLVPGAANPYLSGMPSGSTASGGSDVAGTQSGQVQDSSQFAALAQSPVQVLNLNLSGSTVLTFSVTGSVDYNGGTPSEPTDGNEPGSRGAENGISGFTAHWNTLVGVFLDDSQPDSSDAPEALDFSSGGFDYPALAPALKQVFFIGDGVTSDGTPQQVIVPPGATRLYLGTTDGSGWYNNTGSFSVHVQSKAISYFDATKDFNAATNEVTQVWQYGYTDVSGSGFTSYASPSVTSDDGSRKSWLKSDSDMGVVLNTTGHDLQYNIYTNQPADVLGLFPGNDGRKTIVRWTAPEAGTYLVFGKFEGIDHTTSDASIVQNGSIAQPILFSPNDASGVNYIDGQGTTKVFAIPVVANAGDTLDFRVGWGDNNEYSYDGSGLAAKIYRIGAANSSGGSTLKVSSFSATGPASAGAPITFSATADAGAEVHLQWTTDTSDEGSWTNLPDGNDGKMSDSSNSGNYTLTTTAYPAGSNISFRAIAQKDGFTDGTSTPLGTYTLQQAVLSIQGTVASDSDANGQVVRSGDKLTYKLTFSNTGSAPAKNLKVAMLVPSYVHGSLTFPTKTTKNSKTVTLTSGNTSQLLVGQSIEINPDLPSGTTTVASILNDTQFTISVAATGTDKVNFTFDYDGNQHQFSASDFASISPGGQIVNVSTLASNSTQWILPGGDKIDFLDSHNVPQKAIVWSVGDLEAGFQQFVAYAINVSDAVQVPSDIVGNNLYEVFSAASPQQPPVAADAKTSLATNIPSIDVRGPIKLTLALDNGVSSVAPGGLFNYKLTLSNLSGAKVDHAIAVVDVPGSSRFVSVAATNKKQKIGFHLFHNTSGTNHTGLDQVVINAGQLAAHGDKKGGDSITINLTLQAQWVMPSAVPKLSSIDYAAAFVTSDAYNALLAAANDDVTNINFIDFVTNDSNSTALTKNDSGVVNIALIGTLDHAPWLVLKKAIGDDKTMTLDDPKTEDEGDGDLINTVEPGGEATIALIPNNDGDSAAEDVYIQDQLPVGTVLVTPGNHPKVLTSQSSADDLASAITSTVQSASAKASKKLKVTLDSDNRTLRISGIHLEPHDYLGLTYTLQVLTTGADAPATGDTIHTGAATIGSSSTPQTPISYLADISIKIIGHANLQWSVSPSIPSRPGTSSNATNTANALTPIYSANGNAFPYSATGAPLHPGDARFYIHYANTGDNTNGVKLDIPIPANAVFYRASFVQKGKLVPAPNGVTMTTPAFLTGGGKVTFAFNRLNKNDTGDVMVELILLNAGLDQAHGSFATLDGVVLHTGASKALKLLAADSQQSSGAPSSTPISDVKLGIVESVPPSVAAGDTFDIILSIINTGTTIVQRPFLFWTQPANTTIVSFDYGQGQKQNPFEGDPIHTYSFEMSSNNGPVDYNSGNGSWELAPHTGAIVKITLQASGPAGTNINEGITDATATHVSADYVGKVLAPAHSIIVFANQDLQTIHNRSSVPDTNVVNADFTNLPSGVVVVALGAGNVLATGPSYIVAQGGGNIVAQGAGNIVAQGAGNIMSIKGVADLGDTTAASVLSNLPSLVAKKAANLWNAGTGNIISQDGNNVISNDGGTLLSTIPAIVAQGGGNIVAQGGGNIVAQGGGNIVAQGGGNIVAQGGGNILTYGGAIVAQGGGNIVAQGGGNIVAQGGGNIAVSLRSSSASAIVAQGGGNIVAQGGGNLVPRPGGGG